MKKILLGMLCIPLICSCGQSYMERNTKFSKLNQFCADSENHDYGAYAAGYSNVKISYYNDYDKNNHNYSNITDPTDGLFVNTGLNQGVKPYNFSASEVGLAEVLTDLSTENEPSIKGFMDAR